ncbi:MAG: HD domain-containing protein, partial [Streptococcaceae bacterium]|nr:HD domain-containing protein [Streptococcaceae bacterium]
MAKEVNFTGPEVIKMVQRYMNEEQVKLVQKALDYATEMHAPQVRSSGEPYIIHPIQVAGILAELSMDAPTVATGFLHDVVEDTPVTLEDLAEVFGEEIATL